MIQFHNRKTNRVETEVVYGGQYVDLAYQNGIGFFLTRNFFAKPWLSKIMGVIENTAYSAKKIPAFVKQYNIDMSQYVDGPFQTFNDFFIRKFKPGLRPFVSSPKVFCAGAEARYLAFENVSANTRIQVKNIAVSVSELFGNTAEAKKYAQTFEGGTVIVARLCPVDYHRFHFPCDGEVIEQYTVGGLLHSVNPVALDKRPDIFLINERQVCLFKNKELGEVAMIEVGALGVGKIVQSYAAKKGTQFVKGAEKGYFLFGGSTVVWVLKKGAIQLAEDLKMNSTSLNNFLETWIPLGESLGECKTGGKHVVEQS